VTLQEGATTKTFDWDNITTDASGNAEIDINQNFGDFNVHFAYALSNAPGGEQALLQTSDGKLTNLDSTSSHTLTVLVSSTDFYLPQSPPLLTVASTASGSVGRGSLSGVFTSYADASNTLYGTTFATDQVTFGPIGANASYSGSTSKGGFDPNGSPYSLTNVGTYTLSKGAQVTVSGGNTAVSALAPAPGGIALSLAGLPVLGLGWLRRRQKS